MNSNSIAVFSFKLTQISNLNLLLLVLHQALAMVLPLDVVVEGLLQYMKNILDAFVFFLNVAHQLYTITTCSSGFRIRIFFLRIRIRAKTLMRIRILGVSGGGGWG